MARVFYLSLIYLFCLSRSLAQFHIGVQGGSNLSRMDFTNNPEYRFTEINNSQGFIGGLVIQFLSEKHAGVQAEFNFTQRGWIENDTIAPNNLRYRNHMNYVELPILTHINIGAGNFRGVINLGPYVAYALSRKTSVKDLNTGSEESFDHTFDSEADNRLDFGLLGGGGFEYRMSFGKIAAEARYTIGLGDINKIKIQESELSQFRVLTILVRYTIPLGKATD